MYYMCGERRGSCVCGGEITLGREMRVARDVCIWKERGVRVERGEACVHGGKTGVVGVSLQEEVRV